MWLSGRVLAYYAQSPGFDPQYLMKLVLKKKPKEKILQTAEQVHTSDPSMTQLIPCPYNHHSQMAWTF